MEAAANASGNTTGLHSTADKTQFLYWTRILRRYWTESGFKCFVLRCVSQLCFLPVDLSDTGFNKSRGS